VLYFTFNFNVYNTLKPFKQEDKVTEQKGRSDLVKDIAISMQGDWDSRLMQ